MVDLSFLSDIFSGKNYVVVGGANAYIRGFTNRLKDIDVMILSYNDLPFCEILYYDDKRAYAYSNGYFIDIYIKTKLPPFDMIGDVKYVTMDSAIKYYCNLLKNPPIGLECKIIEKLEMLIYGSIKDNK